MSEKAVISVRGLRYSYVKGERLALNGVSFDVLEGEIFGIIGPDGAGKTTLIKILCGLLPSSENVKVLNLFPYRKRRQLSNYIGYLSQPPSIYDDLSIEENIEFFARIHSAKDYARKKDRLLELTGLSFFRNREVGKLSGGMKQKAGLICALIYTPRILFLDEPTTGVDPASRREFWDILGELKLEGLTVVISTSYMDEAEKCDRVAMMKEGRIILYGSPREIRKGVKERFIEIRGSFSMLDLPHLLEKLKGVRYAQPFGDRLHLCFDPALLKTKDIVDFLKERGIEAFECREVIPSMEDLYFLALKEEGG